MTADPDFFAAEGLFLFSVTDPAKKRNTRLRPSLRLWRGI